MEFEQAKGVPERKLSIVKALYEQSWCNLTHNGAMNGKVEVLLGVIFLLLLNIALNFILGKSILEPELFNGF